MYYDKASLLEAISDGAKVAYTYFYGSEARDGDNACFSQWYLRNFKDGSGVMYNCMEQYVVAAKARMFKDFVVQEQVMGLSSPSGMKTLGRRVKGFVPEVWDRYSKTIVFLGNKLKFEQNPDLWRILNRTGESVLVETSPYNKIWGVGLSARDEEIKDPSAWPGMNYLGFELTRVRDTIRKENKV